MSCNLNNIFLQSTSMDQPHSTNKLSSLLEAKSSDKSSQLEDILPANLSCFTPCMDLKKLKRSSNLMVKEKTSSIAGRAKIQYQNCNVIDLTGDPLLDKQQSKEQLLDPCSMKKRKVLLIERGALQHDKSSNDYASDTQRSGSRDLPFKVSSVKHENLQVSDHRSMLKTEVHLQHKDDGAAEVDAKVMNQKNKGVRLSAEPCGAEERKGSAFLIQVKCIFFFFFFFLFSFQIFF